MTAADTARVAAQHAEELALLKRVSSLSTLNMVSPNGSTCNYVQELKGQAEALAALREGAQSSDQHAQHTIMQLRRDLVEVRRGF